MAADACDAVDLTSLLRSIAPQGELILIATTGQSAEQLAWVANAAANFDALSIHFWLLLSESAEACVKLRQELATVAQLTRVPCAFCGPNVTQRLRLRPGPQAPGTYKWGRTPKHQRTSYYDLLFLRYVVIQRVLRRSVNVLSLDLDAHVVTSPYSVFRSPGFRSHSLILEWDRNLYLNSGCLYIRHRQMGGRGIIGGGQSASQAIMSGLVTHLEAAACGQTAIRSSAHLHQSTAAAADASRDASHDASHDASSPPPVCSESERAVAPIKSVDQDVLLDIFLSMTVNGTVRQARGVPMRESAKERAQREALNRRLLRGWMWQRGPVQRLELGSAGGAPASSTGELEMETDAILERAHAPQRLLTRRLLPSDSAARADSVAARNVEEESALRAPEWLFGQYGGGAPGDMVHPGPSCVQHLVGLEDKARHALEPASVSTRAQGLLPTSPHRRSMCPSIRWRR